MAADVDAPSISVAVLGPLRLTVDGVQVDVPGPKRRAVLALLALGEARTLAVEEIIDALWPADPPVAARAALHTHVSRLRGHLRWAASRLESVPPGYRLRLEPEELDVRRARTLFADARRLADTDPVEAYARLRDARRLWRGPVLADLTDVLPIAARARGLEELRRDVDDLLVECGITAGDAAGVVRVATDAVAEQPLSEPAVLRLVRSLAGTGREADALRAAYEFRRRLKQEAGLDPSTALGELERATAASAATSPARRSTSLPAPVTPLVGREAVVAALQRLLEGERLVTVVGPGGVGKTRVAIDVARRADDAEFLGLAAVSDPAAIPHALASSLHLDAATGDALAACVELLAAGPRLLVVDNCEHLLDGVRATVTTLLESCPELVVLATSRERLGISAECQVRLEPLALPDVRAEHPEHSPAVAVFLERARRARPAFAPDGRDMATIGDIVRRLDGLPLAIELAAGRLSSFTLADLHARLDRALDLLEAGPRGPDRRHQTLRATIDWSYALLTDPEQRLFRHLAVFPDGVDLPTAEAVATDVEVPGDVASALAKLVDASMLDAALDEAPRYRMLETIRSYALDRLQAAGETDEAHERVLRWAVDLARWIDASLHTTDEAAANARLRRELPNLRAAWGLARRHPTLDHAVELVVALDDAAQWRDVPEVWQWAEDLCADPRLRAHRRSAAALASGSDAAWLLGHLDHAAGLAQQALASASDDDGRWRALLASAVVDLSRADFSRALTNALDSAALAPRPAHAHWVAALAAAYAGDVERAEELARRGAATSPTLLAEREYVAGEIASIAGRLDAAERHYRRAIGAAREVDATFVVGIATVGLLTVQTRAGRFVDALRGCLEVLGYWERTGNWIQVWTTLRNLAELLRALGDEEHARYVEIAADNAPEAAAVSGTAWRGDGATPAPPPTTAPTPAVPSRGEVLAAARDAISAHLARARV